MVRTFVQLGDVNLRSVAVGGEPEALAPGVP